MEEPESAKRAPFLSLCDCLSPLICLVTGFVAFCAFIFYFDYHNYLWDSAKNYAQETFMLSTLFLWWHRISEPVPEDEKRTVSSIDHLILTGASCYWLLLFLVVALEKDLRCIFYLVGALFCCVPFGLEVFQKRRFNPESGSKWLLALFAVANLMALFWTIVWIVCESDAYVKQLMLLARAQEGYIVIGFILWCRPFVTIILYRQFERWLTVLFHVSEGGHSDNYDDSVFHTWTYPLYCLIFVSAFVASTRLGRENKLDFYLSIAWIVWDVVIVVWVFVVWMAQYYSNNLKRTVKSLSALLTIGLVSALNVSTAFAIQSPTKSNPHDVMAAVHDPVAIESLIFTFGANLAQLALFVLTKTVDQTQNKWCRSSWLLQMCFAWNVGMIIRDFLLEIDEFLHVIQHNGFLTVYDQIAFALFWAALEFHFVLLDVIARELGLSRTEDGKEAVLLDSQEEYRSMVPINSDNHV